MSQSFKVCPVCKTLNQPNALVCTTCGTLLTDVSSSTRTASAAQSVPAFDDHFGEADLMESRAGRSARTGILILGVIAVFAVGLGIGIFLANRPASTEADIQALPSITLRPSLTFATVTLGPPTNTATNTPLPTGTATETGTPSPCIQIMVAGGSLIAAIINCGYTNLDVMPTVMALNNITDAGSLQLGQEIIIPYPSATFDPNRATLTPAQSSQTGDIALVANVDDMLGLNTAIDPFAPTPTATLPPGVMWHTIEAGDNIITISVAFNANAKTLSELNPEIDFAQCEFGERFGGPECLVQLQAGQLLRVPAPTATPTLSPTPNPNATATPTMTPTYNEPNIVSPSDRQFFDANALVTLRWVPSATLRSEEAYRIDVTDLTTQTSYTAITTDISFLIPQEWQGSDAQRHDFQWTIGVINQNNPTVIAFQTQPRLFVWQGQMEKP